MKQLNGIMPVLISPMQLDGSPDHGGFVRLLDFIFADLSAPIPGLWVLGSSGENFQMAYRHRVEVTKIVAEHMAGRTTLLVGCADPVLSEIFRFFDDTSQLAIDGYHCLPTDRKLSTVASVDYWTAVADRAPRPLWLYSNPSRALEPAVEAVRTLAAHPNIAGIKVGGYNLAMISAIAEMNSPEFQVLGAGGANHLAYLGLGVTCCTLGASGFPRQYALVHALWDEGRLAEARTQSRWINRVISEMPARQNTESSAEEKAVLELFGICERWVYPPYKPLDEQRLAAVKAILETNGLLSDGRASLH